MWKCSRNASDHLLLNVVFPLSFYIAFIRPFQWTGFEVPHLGRRRSQKSNTTTLPFVINVEEEQNMVLRELGNPGDGSHRKGMKCRGSTSLKGVEAAHLEMWRRAQAELNTD